VGLGLAADDKLRAKSGVLIKFAYKISAAVPSKVMAMARLQLFKLNGNVLPFGRLNCPGAPDSLIWLVIKGNGSEHCVYAACTASYLNCA